MPPAPPSFQGCCAPLGAALSRDRAELPAAPGATPDPLRPERRRPSHSGAKGRAEKQNNVFKNPKQPKPNHQPKAKQLVLGKRRPTAREEQRSWDCMSSHSRRSQSAGFLTVSCNFQPCD
ncbi:uncharacterized protein GJ701_002519 [Geothlypis trichas]